MHVFRVYPPTLSTCNVVWLLTQAQDFSVNAMEADARYARLVDWARENGAFIHQSLKFSQTKSHGVECIVGQESNAIEPHEVFMRVHYKLSFSYWNAISAGKPESCYHPQGSLALPRHFLDSCADHETVSAVFLVQQYLLGAESFWYPYLQILPQPHDPEDSAIPLLWSDNDLRWLRGTSLESEVVKKRKELESRWAKAIDVLRESGWDVSAYTIDLGLWAYYIFMSRAFSTLAIEGSSATIKDEYLGIFTAGACIDDVPKVLLPVLDLLNHDQSAGMGYDFKDTGLGLRKAIRLMPGESVAQPYDKDTQRYNNTSLLKEFGFILPKNEFPELVMPPPLDITKPWHPSHVVFSTSSTPDDVYASSDEFYLAFLTVRAPLRHPLGLMNPNAEARALRHFHPKLVSMVSFKMATLTERAALRKEPDAIPSRRNQEATVEFLSNHLRKMLHTLSLENEAKLEPTNHRQRVAHSYMTEQIAIIQDVLKDMQIQSDMFLVDD